MPRTRPSVRVTTAEPRERSSHWMLWMLAGTAIGVTAGVLAAERFSGRKPSANTLFRRVRGMSKVAMAQWGPLLDLALELKDVWAERRAVALDDGLEEEDELEDTDEYEEADPPADEDEEFDDDLDEDLDDDLEDEDEEEEEEDEEEDDDEENDDEEDEDEPVIGLRVLEAFSHDPILAERAIEIEADDDGVILLHGAVRTAREVSHAVTLAKGVPGVTRVRQRLTVRNRR